MHSINSIGYVLTLCNLMDVPIQIQLLRIGLLIIHKKGSQTERFNDNVLQSLKIVFIMIANSAGPGKMPHKNVLRHFVWVPNVCLNTPLGEDTYFS